MLLELGSSYQAQALGQKDFKESTYNQLGQSINEHTYTHITNDQPYAICSYHSEV